jgi:hypothetical protein
LPDPGRAVFNFMTGLSEEGEMGGAKGLIRVMDVTRRP